MYKNLLGENLQEQVTLGYGKEMWQKGYEEGLEIARKQLMDEEFAIGKTEGRRLVEERFREAIASSGISEEEKNKIMENYKKLSSE